MHDFIAFLSQEKFGPRRKIDNPKKLTFEQRLSIIINDRPGLNGDRKTRQAIKQNAKADLASRLPQTSTSKTACSPLGDTTNQIRYQHEDNRSDNILGSTNNAPCERSQPKLPGKLCQVAYISPRKKPYPNQSGSARKSPCKRLHELSSAKETAPFTPTRSDFGRLKPGLRSGACRYTAEALDKLRKGLPLPPVERRFEYYDEIKARGATPKRTDENDPHNGEDAQASRLKEAISSTKIKKSVRWADKSDNGKPVAHKHLNFETVSTCLFSLSFMIISI